MKGEYRFYGRTETGNRLLSEGEVARLYERRQRSAVDRNEILNTVVATENLGNRAVDLIYERAIAANAGKFLAVMAELYDAAGYVSPVDIGFAVTNIQGGVAAEWYERQQRGQFVFDFPKYTAQQFTRTTRVSAGELRDPGALIDRLFRRLMDALVGPGFDPLADPKSK